MNPSLLYLSTRVYFFCTHPSKGKKKKKNLIFLLWYWGLGLCMLGKCSTIKYWGGGLDYIGGVGGRQRLWQHIAVLKLQIPLCLPLACWDYRHASLYWVLCMLCCRSILGLRACQASTLYELISIPPVLPQRYSKERWTLVSPLSYQTIQTKDPKALEFSSMSSLGRNRLVPLCQERGVCPSGVDFTQC